MTCTIRAVAVLGGVCASACAALPYSGYAVEGYAAATRLDPTDDASPEADEGVGISIGLNLLVEIDYIRSVGMGMGIGYVTTSLPTQSGSEQFGFTPPQYDVSSAFTSLGNDLLRPRMYAGVLLGTGTDSGDSLFAAYVGAGASYHVARGTALHLFTGPQALALENNGEDLSYTGTGWFVRARLYRSFFARCDIAPSEAAERSDRGRTKVVPCR